MPRNRDAVRPRRSGASDTEKGETNVRQTKHVACHRRCRPDAGIARLISARPAAGAQPAAGAAGRTRPDAAERRPGRRAAAARAGSRSYKPVTADRLKQTGRRRLADVPPHLRRLGLQPARRRSRRRTSARLQPVWAFATGADRAAIEAPPIVNNGVMFVATPGNQVLAHRREDRRRCCGAIKRPLPEDVIAAASDQPRRRAVRRQGVLRRGRSGARGARREDRQGSLDDQGRGQQARATTCRWRRWSPTAR